MQPKRKLNKAISESVEGLVKDGINVNINVPTNTLVRLGFFTVVVTLIISFSTYALHWLKTH